MSKGTEIPGSTPVNADRSCVRLSAREASTYRAQLLGIPDSYGVDLRTHQQESLRWHDHLGWVVDLGMGVSGLVSGIVGGGVALGVASAVGFHA